jgi:hypothetical protein
MFRNSFVFRLIGVVLLLGLLVAGGAIAYKAGVSQGIVQAPAVATAISKAAESGQAAPVPPMMYGQPYGYGYGPGYYPMAGHHFFGFFPFGICGSIFFLFLFFGLIKMIFFRRMMWARGSHGHHGPWGRHWEDGVPPMFNEWHKRAHGGQPEDEKKEDESNKQ